MQRNEAALDSPPRPLKVVVVSAGQGGSTCAYTMLLKGGLLDERDED